MDIIHNQLRKKVRKHMLVMTAGLLIIVFFLGWNMEKDVPLLGRGGKDITEVQEYEMARGNARAVTKVDFIGGVLEQDEEGEYFFIPYDTDSYICMYVYQEDLDKFQELKKASQDYLEQRTQRIEASPVQAYGYLYEIDDESFEAIKESTVLGKKLKPYLFTYVPYWDLFQPEDKLKLGLALMTIVYLVYTWIKTLFGLQMRQVEKFKRENGISDDFLERDLQSGYQTEDIWIGQKYMLCYLVRGSQIFMTEDVVWAYQNTTKVNHVPMYYLVIYLKNGKKIRQQVNTEALVHEILYYMGESLPNVRIGYSRELKKQIKQETQRKR